MTFEATYYFRIVCLGDSNVGKTTMCTSIIRKKIFDDCISEVASTIGAEFTSTTEIFEQNKNVRLDLWDTAGQEKFRSLVPLFFRHADML